MIDDYLTPIIIGIMAIIGIVVTVVFSINNSAEQKQNKIEYKYIANQYGKLVNSENPTKSDFDKVKSDIKSLYDTDVFVVFNNCIAHSTDKNNSDRHVKVRVSEYIYITITSTNYYVEDTSYIENKDNDYQIVPVIY